MSAFFWKIQFPFHARSFQNSRKLKYVHLGCLAAGLLLPLVVVTAPIVEFAIEIDSDIVLQRENVTVLSGGLGYGMIRFPPLLCSGTKGIVQYYCFALPINIAAILGLTELVVIFWKIMKVSVD